MIYEKKFMQIPCIYMCI